MAAASDRLLRWMATPIMAINATHGAGVRARMGARRRQPLSAR